MIEHFHATGLAVAHLLTRWPAPRLSVIAKGLFRLVPDGALEAAGEPPRLLADEPLEGAPGRLRHAADLVPFKPAADVTLVGAAPRAEIRPALRIGVHVFEAEAGVPHAFAPIAPTAADRRARLGTYDQKWVAERWPWFPDDFDPRYFNAAPRAMQIDGHLRGDERLILDGLAPGHARLATRLPGLRVRCFLAGEDRKSVELPLRLDTVWIDAAAQRASVVWRGITDLRSEDAEEVKVIHVATEPLAEPPRSEAHHAEQLALLMLTRERATKEAAAAAFPRRPSNDNLPRPDDAKTLAEIRQVLARADLPGEVAAAVSNARSIQGLLDTLQGLVQPDTGKVDALQAESKERAKKLLAEHGQDPALLDEPAPKAAEPEWTRERVRDAAAAGTSMAGVDLRGRDLSGLDLTGAKLEGALLGEALLRGTKLYDADLRRASLVKADLSGATLGLAKLEAADLTGATAQGLDLWKADLSRAVLDGATLTEARLDEAKAEGASFRGTDLSRAKLAKANLREALLVGAALDGVDARGAVLVEATLEAAHGQRACFAGADLRRLRAGRDASLPGADLSGAQAEHSIWTGADLTGATLSRGRFGRADLSRAKLDGAKLDGCNCESADVTRSSLRGADLRGANLGGACLDSADLERADARSANLYEAELWRARVDGLRLEGAHVAMTKLVKR